MLNINSKNNRKQAKMKLTVFVVNALVVFGSPITPNLPDKLRQYQMVTGISETELLSIYKNHLSGQFAMQKLCISKMIRNILLGKHDRSYPKFRLTGTAPSGDVHPVQFQTELLNVEAVINAGVFLCLEPGYYHFSAAMSAGGLEWIGVEIIHNGKRSIYAR